LHKIIQILFSILERISPKIGGLLGVKFFLTPFGKNSHPAEDHFNLQSRIEIFFVDEKEVVVRHWGDGPLILLAHGWSSYGASFMIMIQQLNELGFSTMAPDFTAHGSSPGKMSNIIEFGMVVEFLLKKYPETYGLVGHSLGGLACIIGSSGSCPALKKLVTIGTPVYFEHVLDNFIMEVKAGPKIRNQMKHIIANRFSADPNEYSSASLILQKPKHVKLLVIQDSHDPEVSLSDAKDLVSLGQGELIITKGLGHNGGIRDADTIKLVGEFLLEEV
jgi:esterase/lipase